MTGSTRRVTVAGLVGVLVAAFVALAAPAHATGHAPDRTYRVTVENLTDTQLMTPMVAASHGRSFHVFHDGEAASPGIQQLAENGGVPVLVDELAANGRVSAVAVVGEEPIAPGGSATAYLTAARSARRVSLAGMLICTNDGFAGVDSVRLPRWVGDTKTYLGNAYDAGTEINTESYADLVGGCDGKGQSGMTNPALAENGVVRPHDGILGGADLTQADHGWTDPVIELALSRIG